MGTTRLAVICAAAFAFTLSPLTASAGDAAKAKRDLMWTRSAVESQKWDDFIQNMKKVEADMEGLSSDEKTPLMKEVTELKAMVTKSVEEDVSGAPGQGKRQSRHGQV